MRMKKIFTLIAMALMAVGANAQTTIFDAAAADWASADLTTGTTTVGDVTWYGGGSASIDGGATVEGVTWGKRLKTGGGSTFKTGSFGRVLTFTPAKAGKVKVYGTHGSSSGDPRTIYISQSVTSTNRDESTSLGKYALPAGEKGIAEATVEAGVMVYVWADSNVGIYGITFEEVATEAADATFSLTNTNINTYQTSQIKVNSKAGLDGLTMKNLTFDNNVITIDETGKITPVAAGTSAITFTTDAVDGKYKAGTANLSITVTAATLDEQESVSATSTWDWSKFGVSEIKLDDNTNPKKTVEFVLSNVITYGYCTTIGTDFGNAKALKVMMEYPVRGGSYCQGASIKINTTVAGKLSVTYSNTGTRSDEAQRRYLNVNGTNYGTGTMDTEQTTTADIAVAAGEVTISGRMGTDTTTPQFLRYYKIVFTKSDTDGIQTAKATIAEQSAPAYNLAGQKVDKSFKGVVIQNGKKMIQK